MRRELLALGWLWTWGAECAGPCSELSQEDKWGYGYIALRLSAQHCCSQHLGAVGSPVGAWPQAFELGAWDRALLCSGMWIGRDLVESNKSGMPVLRILH